MNKWRKRLLGIAKGVEITLARKKGVVMIDSSLDDFFGINFSDKEKRRDSYDYLENFIVSKHTDWTKTPDTENIAVAFAKELKSLDVLDLGFLISHSGYIPEFYGHDSSQETLYSKLVEVLVCEWALRVGLDGSYIQKQKASKEDVTIVKDNFVIVCDAKSYRLGRSQSAPNVKDTLKKADYTKWLSAYDSSQLKPIGGLVTFPSLHQWKRGGDAILYSTDYNLPIPILYYEHLAFFLVENLNGTILVKFINDYKTHFAEPTSDQSVYLAQITKRLFDDNSDRYEAYSQLIDKLLQEKVAWTIESVENRLSKSKSDIQKKIASMPVEDLKVTLVESEYSRLHYTVIRQLKNIVKFRTPKKK